MSRYRLAKIPMEAVLRARTLSETRGFLKALIETDGDRILGFTAFGAEAGEVMAVVQVAMLGGPAVHGAAGRHPDPPDDGGGARRPVLIGAATLMKPGGGVG